jgi:hypothetical protein
VLEKIMKEKWGIYMSRNGPFYMSAKVGGTLIQALSRACRGIYFGKVPKNGLKATIVNLAKITMIIWKITGNEGFY